MSPKQKALYDYILKYWTERGYAPSYREMAADQKTGLATIHRQIGILREVGLIGITRVGRRNIFPISLGKALTNLSKKAMLDDGDK